MASLKISMFFERVGGGEFGWSETYYNSATDPVAFIKALAPAKPDPRNVPFAFLQARRQLLSGYYQVSGVRASVLGKRRQSLPWYVPENKGAGLSGILNAGEPNIPPVEPWTSLLCSCYGGTEFPHRKALYLGGVTEAQLTPPRAYTPGADFEAALEGFFSVLVDGGFQVLPRPDSATAVQITSFAVSADCRTAVLAPSVLAPGANQTGEVIVRGLKNPPGWDGQHRAFSRPTNVPGTFEMVLGPTRRPYPSAPAFTESQGATVELVTINPVQITFCEPVRFVSRKRGRPFDALRGRRNR